MKEAGSTWGIINNECNIVHIFIIFFVGSGDNNCLVHWRGQTTPKATDSLDVGPTEVLVPIASWVSQERASWSSGTWSLAPWSPQETHSGQLRPPGGSARPSRSLSAQTLDCFPEGRSKLSCYRTTRVSIRIIAITPSLPLPLSLTLLLSHSLCLFPSLHISLYSHTFCVPRLLSLSLSPSQPFISPSRLAHYLQL